MPESLDKTHLVIDYVPVCKTPFVFDKHKDVLFQRMEIKMCDICNSDKYLPLKISIFNFANQGDPQLYGSTITTVKEIEMGKTKHELISYRNKVAGNLQFDFFNIDMQPSFL